MELEESIVDVFFWKEQDAKDKLAYAWMGYILSDTNEGMVPLVPYNNESIEISALAIRKLSERCFGKPVNEVRLNNGHMYHPEQQSFKFSTLKFHEVCTQMVPYSPQNSLSIRIKPKVSRA
jgi:hypothetical protein